LAPVAAFGTFDELRSDFAAPSLTTVTLRHALNAFRPILQRLEEIPDLTGHPDHDGLLVLGLAYTRQKPVEATWNPRQSDALWYPLLGPVPAARRRLEGLAELDLLHRRFFKRASICGRCGSSRLSAYEACIECGGGHLAEEEIVHHYACGHEAAESTFLVERDLVCPKCRKELRHLGVDYDKPGMIVACGGCGTVMAEPQVAFDCLDCGHATPGDGIETIDWFHYDLTHDGIAAVHDGRLPHIDFANLLTPFSRAYPVRDFVMLARECLNVAERYDRPFALVEVSVTNAEELRDNFGSDRLTATFRMIVDVFAESVREVDLIAATADQRIILVLPETPEASALILTNRFEETVKETIELPVQLENTVATGKAAADILENCQ
jgi:GGDEF domain-containing protein